MSRRCANLLLVSLGGIDLDRASRRLEAARFSTRPEGDGDTAAASTVRTSAVNR